MPDCGGAPVAVLLSTMRHRVERYLRLSSELPVNRGRPGHRPHRPEAMMTTPARPLRFGLVGTGHWARVTHAPALASTEGIEFAAVWGRNPEAAAALAARHGAVAYRDLGDFLAGLDGVAFSVPPDVQSE